MSVMASRPPNMPAGAGTKRPRLSLQIKTSSSASPSRPASRGFPLNPSDPTAFNTLSNAYVTAIERTSTPVTAQPAASTEPLTAIDTFQAISLSSPINMKPRATMATPIAAAAGSALPETPVSAHPVSSPRLALPLPSVMSPTPPMSAGAVETGSGRVFSFSPRDSAAGKHSLEQALSAAAATTPFSPVATPPQKRTVSFGDSSSSSTQQHNTRTSLSSSPPPYTRAKALHSILRNSPLPSRSSLSSSSSISSPRQPREQQQQRLATTAARIQDRAAKRVCYHSPIEQEITTNKYVKSHIDLLVEEAASPCSPRPLDLSRAFTANEIQDGGQTPGPFEDPSKRLDAATAAATAAAAGGETARKFTVGGGRGEKKRRWVWTIGREEDADEDEEQLGGAVVAAARAAAAAAAGSAPTLTMPCPGKKETDTTKTAGVDVEMS